MNKFANVSLLCLMVSFSLISCETPEANGVQDVDEPEEIEYVEVGFTSVDIEVTESPMTKTASSDLYGLCIWERDVDNPFYIDESYYEDEEGNIYQPLDTIYNYSNYACWLSDDLSLSDIRLRKNRTYLCVLVYVPNGKNILYNYGDGRYGNPFSNNSSSLDPILGAGVHYGGGYDMERALYGIAQAVDKRSNYRDANDMSPIEVYYGTKIIKATKNEEIIINLYRMMYGLEIKANNFIEGKIHIYGGFGIGSYAKALELDAYVYTMTPDNPSLDMVLELSKMPWRDDVQSLIQNTPTDDRIMNWKAGHTICVDYEYPNGDVIRLFSKGVDGKRMVKYTMEFDVAELIEEYSNSFKQNVIEDSWTTEEIE